MTGEPIAVGTEPVRMPVGLFRVQDDEPWFRYRVMGVLPLGDGWIEAVSDRVKTPYDAFDAARTRCERAGRLYLVRDDQDGLLLADATGRCEVVERLGKKRGRCSNKPVGFDYDAIDCEPVAICVGHLIESHAGIRISDHPVETDEEPPEDEVPT